MKQQSTNIFHSLQVPLGNWTTSLPVSTFTLTTSPTSPLGMSWAVKLLRSGNSKRVTRVDTLWHTLWHVVAPHHASATWQTSPAASRSETSPIALPFMQSVFTQHQSLLYKCTNLSQTWFSVPVFHFGLFPRSTMHEVTQFYQTSFGLLSWEPPGALHKLNLRAPIGMQKEKFNIIFNYFTLN